MYSFFFASFFPVGFLLAMVLMRYILCRMNIQGWVLWNNYNLYGCSSKQPFISSQSTFHLFITPTISLFWEFVSLIIMTYYLLLYGCITIKGDFYFLFVYTWDWIKFLSRYYVVYLLSLFLLIYCCALNW